MFKRVIILVVLSSILLALVFIRDQNVAPINTSTKSNSSPGFITVEYKISNINGNQYYGKSDDGTEIHFSSKKILSGVKIQVHDKVICYFEKNNLGKGLIKVEKY